MKNEMEAGLEIYEEIYENRLLVFLETGPQTNKYHQVLLNSEHFKKVSDAVTNGRISIEDAREGFEVVEFPTSEEEYGLPDLQSIN